MKLFRLVVVMLLVCLLPVRGAVAATMSCMESSGVARADSAMTAASQAHHAHHDPHGQHATGGSQAGPDGHHDDPGDPAGHDGACQLCASGCHAVALTTEPPALVGPGLVAAVVFPPLDVAAAAFQSAGLERPPRTC